MEGHAALPDLQQIEGIGEDLIEAIEEHVAQAATDDDADHAIKEQVVHHRGGPARIRPPGAVPAQGPKGAKADQVHEAVPVDLEGAQGQGDGVDIGIGQHGAHFSASWGLGGGWTPSGRETLEGVPVSHLNDLTRFPWTNRLHETPREAG